MKITLMLGVSLSLIASVAVAQSPMHERGEVESRAEGAKVLLDRGQGKVEIQCAKGDTTRSCIATRYRRARRMETAPWPCPRAACPPVRAVSMVAVRPRLVAIRAAVPAPVRGLARSNRHNEAPVCCSHLPVAALSNAGKVNVNGPVQTIGAITFSCFRYDTPVALGYVGFERRVLRLQLRSLSA
jgi:hypothetical protein